MKEIGDVVKITIETIEVVPKDQILVTMVTTSGTIRKMVEMLADADLIIKIPGRTIPEAHL